MAEEAENPKKRGYLDSFIEFIFSKDERKWLILILLIGIILRFIVAGNIDPLADESVHGPHAIGFLHSGLISTVVECPLWFYLTDIALNIFGVTFFSVRFLSFFFGSLTIILAYLIGSKFFSKKIGIISSFLLAVSFFTIRFTLAEMDLSAAFFLILAVYSFIISVEKGKFPLLAAVCIGLASSLKTLSLFFVPAFLIGLFLFNKRKEEQTKKDYILKNLKWILYSGLIVLFFFSPILIHNYLLYKDKGIVDIYFSQYFNPNNSRQVYPDQGTTSLLSSNFFEGIIFMFKRFYLFEPLIFSLGLLGILLYLFKKEKDSHRLFFILFELSGFILLLIASNWLDTHYTTMIPILCIFASLFIVSFSSSLSKKINIDSKTIIKISLVIILIFQIWIMLPYLTSRCGSCKMRNYAISSMDKNSIVVVDPRIYRGEIVWSFHDFHYLELSLFSDVMNLNENMSGVKVPTKAYFIECAIDDCGWGTIKDQPEFNATMEEFFSSLPVNSLEKVLNGGGGTGGQNAPHFKIYQVALNLNPQIIPMIDSTHSWYYYPVNYIPKEQIFDRYEVNGAFDKLIYKFAWLVLIISIILAILFSAIPFAYLLKNR
ncbi:MAG: glycosyltransferase family 39 protein [Nanoarchaeota archaeon]